MKARYIILVIALFSAATCFGQNKLFDKFSEMDNVTSVYISKAMFQMLPNIDAGGLNLGDMKEKIESLKILTTEDKSTAEKMRKDFSSLEKRDREELMRVRDGDTRATFFAIKDGDTITELFMLADSDDNFVIIQLLGRFTLQDIQNITNVVSK
jgi:hypothetical protein